MPKVDVPKLIVLTITGIILKGAEICLQNEVKRTLGDNGKTC
jgi:hypothetical protein